MSNQSGDEDAASTRYKPSRFNAMRTVDSTLMMANSFSGAVVAIPEQEAASVKPLMKGFEASPDTRKEVIDLIDLGFFVPEGVNEMSRVNNAHAAMNDQRTMQLIIMPTEDCNFRCIYCYESFKKKAMRPETRAKVKAFLERRIPRLESLEIAWFGGEPLFAFDVMQELTEFAMTLCDKYGTQFQSNITTNGYLMREKELRFLLDSHCKYFQITLDGDKESHDRSRHLNGGGATFDIIWANLLRLQESEADFQATIRVNVDEKNYLGAMNFTDTFTKQFGDDARFRIDFKYVWNYADTAKEEVELLGTDAADRIFSLRQSALEQNGRDCIGYNVFGIGAYYCYASKTNALVVGSDAMIYKCTVAFEDPRNQVGFIDETGDLIVDTDKWSLWTANDYRNDSECQKCFYVPSCMGASCALVRIESGERPCPDDKTDITSTMRTMHKVHRAIAKTTS